MDALNHYPAISCDLEVTSCDLKIDAKLRTGFLTRRQTPIVEHLSAAASAKSLPHLQSDTEYGIPAPRRRARAVQAS
jgi:hypothetical protein